MNERLINEILSRGLEDWVMAAEVASVAIAVGGASTPEDIQSLSLDLIDALIARGLMRAGNVGRDGFSPWDLSPEESVKRVKTLWEELGALPDLGDVCWLELTELGATQARATGST